MQMTSMSRASYWAFLILGLLLVTSDTMKALGRAVLSSEVAEEIHHVIGTALDCTGESSNWMSRLNEREDSL